eukprot:11134043-Ditylum_brightwellii.AAC.1
MTLSNLKRKSRDIQLFMLMFLANSVNCLMADVYSLYYSSVDTSPFGVVMVGQILVWPRFGI